MLDEVLFQQIFGDANTQYQKGKKDCFEDKGKRSNNADYLKGYETHESIEKKVKTNG